MSTRTGTVEGWSNYETWAVNLWLSNDEPLCREARALTRRALRIVDEDNEETRDEGKREATNNLAEGLKRWVVEMQPELTGLWADLLGAALCDVDWYEIAGAWMGGES